MAEEPSTHPTLSASIGEQLEEKRVLGERAAAERETSARQEDRIERHKAEERAEVARHLGGPAAATEGWRRARALARAGERMAAQLRDWGAVLALPVAAAGGFAVARWLGPRRRRSGPPVALLAALAGGVALSRRHAPAA